MLAVQRMTRVEGRSQRDSSATLQHSLGAQKTQPLPSTRSRRRAWIREGQGPRRERAERAQAGQRGRRRFAESDRFPPSTRARPEQAGGGQQKQWIYRDALKPVAELDGSGNLVAQFVYGSKGNVPDYVRRGGATYRVVSDHLGSPRYVVNVANAGDVPFTANYSAFGSVTGTGLDWMPFGFAGGIYDEDTRLLRFGARDYDPMVGRWTSKDPIRFAGQDGPNLYAYVNGDPVNFIDQTGRQSQAIPWGPIIGGAAAGAAAGSAAGGVGAIPGALIGACIGALFLTGDTPEEDDCDKEWSEAYERCGQEIANRGRHNRGITGGYRNLQDCARGLVSQRCGGNPI